MAGKTNGQTKLETQSLPLNNGAKCSKKFFGAYPEEVHAEYLVGGILYNKVVTCGGFAMKGDTATDKCYEPLERTNKAFARMAKERGGAAGIVVDDPVTTYPLLWITGGANAKDGILDSTEYISASGQQKDGPKLPFAVKHHCLVKWNQTTSVMIGGKKRKDGSPVSNFNIFDHEVSKWSHGPTLKTGRWLHHCGTFSYGDKRGIVVAGGKAREERLKSTDFLMVTGEGGWIQIQGPDLPERVSSGRSASLEDGSFVIAGGRTANGRTTRLFKLACHGPDVSEGCHWTLMEQKLAIVRTNHLALPVPFSKKHCG